MQKLGSSLHPETACLAIFQHDAVTSLQAVHDPAASVVLYCHHECNIKVRHRPHPVIKGGLCPPVINLENFYLVFFN